MTQTRNPKIVTPDGSSLNLRDLTAGQYLKRVGSDVESAQVQTSEIGIPVIGAPALNQLQEKLDAMLSSGVISGGGITDAGGGNIDIAAGAGFIRATDSDTAEVLSFEWSAVTGYTPTDAAISYIYVEYNGGAPQIVVTTAERTDHNTNLFLGTVYRSGLVVHPTPRREFVANALHMLSERLYRTFGLTRESGGVVGETGTRNITVTEFTGWISLNQITTLAGGFNSSGADRFTYFYRDGGGGWTAVASQAQIDNTQYDDGSGALATLGSNKYGVHWVYIGVDDHVYVVYGRDDYTLKDAQDATPPSDIPPHFQLGHGVLAAKIIIQKSAASFESLQSAFVQQFTATGATSHSDLSNLSSDDHPQYLLIDGTRAMTGNLDANGNDVNNVKYQTHSEQATPPASTAAKYKTYAKNDTPNNYRGVDDGGGEVYIGVRHNIVRAYQGSDQDFAQATWTKLVLDTESFDLESTFDAATLYRFTPNVAGYYQINWNVEFALYDAVGEAESIPFNTAKFYAFKTAIYKNGVIHSGGSTDSGVGAGETVTKDTYPESHGSDVVYLNGATDYIELYAFGVDGSGTLSVRVKAGAPKTYLSASLLNIK